MHKPICVIAALAISLFAARPVSAQEAPPPNYTPPSPLEWYLGVIGHAQFFDAWNALPPGDQYEFGLQAGGEFGIRYFQDPWYATLTFEGYFYGHTEHDGTLQGAGTFRNKEDYQLYGGCFRVGNGSINYNFGVTAAGGYIHLDETVTPPPGFAIVGSGKADDWYIRAGVFFERVLFGKEYGFRMWIGLDLDYTWTGIGDALGGKNMKWWGVGLRFFATF
jgi:hypothetical protein